MKKLAERLNFGKAIDRIPKDLEKFVHESKKVRVCLTMNANINFSSSTAAMQMRKVLPRNPFSFDRVEKRCQTGY